jgi:hypothetical protein
MAAASAQIAAFTAALNRTGVMPFGTGINPATGQPYQGTLPGEFYGPNGQIIPPPYYFNPADIEARQNASIAMQEALAAGLLDAFMEAAREFAAHSGGVLPAWAYGVDWRAIPNNAANGANPSGGNSSDLTIGDIAEGAPTPPTPYGPAFAPTGMGGPLPPGIPFGAGGATPPPSTGGSAGGAGGGGTAGGAVPPLPTGATIDAGSRAIVDAVNDASDAIVAAIGRAPLPAGAGGAGGGTGGTGATLPPPAGGGTAATPTPPPFGGEGSKPALPFGAGAFPPPMPYGPALAPSALPYGEGGKSLPPWLPFGAGAFPTPEIGGEPLVTPAIIPGPLPPDLPFGGAEVPPIPLGPIIEEGDEDIVDRLSIMTIQGDTNTLSLIDALALAAAQIGAHIDTWTPPEPYVPPAEFSYSSSPARSPSSFGARGDTYNIAINGADKSARQQWREMMQEAKRMSSRFSPYSQY